MAILKPFKGIRPIQDKAASIASKPYDVLNDIEAKVEAGDNINSFYHVIKPEIDFPVEFDHYAPAIYEKGKENMMRMISEGVFNADATDCYYIYRQTMDGRSQAGIVGCAGVEDYFNDIIKKHELTRPDKEEDRKNHVRVSQMNYEPVFFAYPQAKGLDVIMEHIMAGKPEYDFVADDGIGHTLWVVSDGKTINDITTNFANVKYTYVADGHHRTAAAALVGKEMREKNPNHTGNEEYNYFLAVHFPDNQLKIFDYNRVIKDLNGLTAAEFIAKLGESFIIEEKGTATYRPNALHNFGLFIEGKWYSLTAKSGTFNDADPIGVLDVTILSERILAPMLDIKDLRTDKRIEFVGGIRGLGELEKRVNSGEMKAAFALYAVSMKQLIDIADSGQIMPPKTTWFEPKLRSGLVIHSLV